MLSLGTINEMQREAAERACSQRRVPFVYWPQDDLNPPFKFPNLGDHVPDGWIKVDGVLVDSFGGEGDFGVLGVDDFISLVATKIAEHAASGKTIGWGITCVFEFCVEVSWFERADEQEG